MKINPLNQTMFSGGCSHMIGQIRQWMFGAWCFFPVLLWLQTCTEVVSRFRGCILGRMNLKANYVTTPREGCPNSKAPPNAAYKCSLLFGGCTATILRSLPYPKIPCVPRKERSDIARFRLSLSQAWAAEIVRVKHGDATRKCSEG